jgi:hypothetical protein
MPSFSELTVPTGLISVMPQPCSTVTPCPSRNARIMDSGTAAPPMTVRSRLSSVLPLLSRYCRSADQTVGTPAASVTRSSVINRCSVSPSAIFGPGNTSFVPTIGPANGSPQALT